MRANRGVISGEPFAIVGSWGRGGVSQKIPLEFVRFG